MVKGFFALFCFGFFNALKYLVRLGFLTVLFCLFKSPSDKVFLYSEMMWQKAKNNLVTHQEINRGIIAICVSVRLIFSLSSHGKKFMKKLRSGFVTFFREAGLKNYRKERKKKKTNQQYWLYTLYQTKWIKFLTPYSSNSDLDMTPLAFYCLMFSNDLVPLFLCSAVNFECQIEINSHSLKLAPLEEKYVVWQ